MSQDGQADRRLMRDVWITGCGLVSALGEGEAQHWARLDGAAAGGAVDSTSFAPFHVYPIGQLELDRHIPRRGDQRAMGPLMQYGTYAAGMALQAAGVAGDEDLLGRMHLLAASGGGERDVELDEQILATLCGGEAPQAALNEATLNERLMNGLRPTLFLAQLPNLFAGNISIVHGVSGSSRTFMGEESAGVDAVRIGFERIAAGQGDLVLVGSAFNAGRWDTHLIYQPGGLLLSGAMRGLWERPRDGICLGSAGTFLVLEAREHAERRGAAPLARLSAIRSDRCSRAAGAAASNAARQWVAVRPKLRGNALAVLSGACGSGPITREERDFLQDLAASGIPLTVRGTAAALGHSVESAFLTNLVLAISCLERRKVFAPLAPEEPLEARDIGAVDQVLVTGWGHRRGEGMALLQTVE
jgi:3-oxoacyl-[acyl-carrier-protein] synthase II